MGIKPVQISADIWFLPIVNCSATDSILPILTWRCDQEGLFEKYFKTSMEGPKATLLQ